MIAIAKSISKLLEIGDKKNQFATKHVKMFSLCGTHFPCPTRSTVGRSRFMIEKRIVELNAKKKVLAISRTAEHSSLETRNGTRKLRFVDQRDWDLERDFGPGI